MSSGAQRAPAATVIALLVLSLALFLALLPGDLRNNGDTVDRFFVTRALVRSGTAAVACPGPGSPPISDTRLALGRHHCYYAIYAPGQTLAMIPLYTAGKGISVLTGAPSDFTIAIAVHTLDPILGAILVVVFFLLLVELGYRRRTAILMTLVLIFASTLPADVQSGQEQTQSALALLVAVLALLKARRGGPRRDRWILAGGVAAGVGIGTRYDFVVPVVVLAGFLVWMLLTEAGNTPALARLRGITPFLLGLVPFLALDAAWNMVRFGSPFSVGESAGAQLGFPPWQGIPNLLISPGKGLLWYLPLLWLIPLVVLRFRRRDGQALALIATLVLASVVFYSTVIYWHGDPAWGPRYLFPLVPVLLVPGCELIDRPRDFAPLIRMGAIALLIASLALQIVSVSADPWRFWYHLIQVRSQASQRFVWNPRRYGYYWDAGLAPELYQFRAARDIIAIGLGDRRAAMPTAGTAAIGPAGSSVRAYDARQLVGVAKRPLNSPGPVWLDSRYQWLTPAVVPLPVWVRLLVLLALPIAGLAALMRLLRQVRAPPGSS